MAYDTDITIQHLASRQHGVVAQRQAARSGVPSRSWERRVEAGLLVPVDTGVCRVLGSEVSWQQRVMAATLASGGVASHRSAGRLLGIVRSSAVEVLVDSNRWYRTGSAITHRSLDLREQDLTVVDGIPTTNLVRTLLDLGAVVGPGTLEIAFDRARHEHGLRLEALTDRFLQVARRGRRGVGPLRALLEERDPSLAPTESALETLVLRILRLHGVPDPVPQYVVVVGGEEYRLDFAWPGAMVALEVDGRHHDVADQFERDRTRQNALVLAGWQVLRSTTRQVRNNPAGLALATERALTRSSGVQRRSAS